MSDEAERIGTHLLGGWMPAYTQPARTKPWERFWSKVGINGTCWVWLGSVRRGGYGVFVYRTAPSEIRQTTTHRFLWEVMYGPIPEGMKVCHTCDNPRCVRPSHLWLGTDYDNAWDKMRKGRDNLAGRKWKSWYRPNTKLTMAKAMDIRRRVAAGERRIDLAREYDVSATLIWRILTRRAWADD